MWLNSRRCGVVRVTPLHPTWPSYLGQGRPRREATMLRLAVYGNRGRQPRGSNPRPRGPAGGTNASNHSATLSFQRAWPARLHLPFLEHIGGNDLVRTHALADRPLSPAPCALRSSCRAGTPRGTHQPSLTLCLAKAYTIAVVARGQALIDWRLRPPPAAQRTSCLGTNARSPSEPTSLEPKCCYIRPRPSGPLSCQPYSAGWPRDLRLASC